MQEIWSFGSVIALWLGVSFGLWWVHRRSTHARQWRELDQSVRAAGFAAKASEVFDAIRADVPLPRAPADPDARLAAQTHALLKRIQDHGAFFDEVNALRVQMQASLSIDDYQPLSEILHLRRDLWAASEIVLVEDLSGFGSSFAEEGSYESFRDEAVALLFKLPGASGDEGDVIDLRLSLARRDADRFIVELQEAIAAARERDRLPTPSEIIAYPVAAIRAMPKKLRLAQNFLSAFFAYSGDIARSIRDSETMERGRRHLQSAREELPQRLSAGFERASSTARESAGHLRRHYDFLVAAHDFQAKYERVLHRAPELTERGRQFIARLELAERSERLRLTSANVMIWAARRLIDVLAHFIAGLQILLGALSRTTPYAFLAALFAPAPARGRLTPAFPSYQMALAASGLREVRASMAAPLQRTAEPPRPLTRAASAVAKDKGKAATAAPAKRKPASTADKPTTAEAKKKAAKAEVQPAPPRAKAKAAIAPPSPPPASVKRPAAIKKAPAPVAEVKPEPVPPKQIAPQPNASAATRAAMPDPAAPVKPVRAEPPKPAPAAKAETIEKPKPAETPKPVVVATPQKIELPKDAEPVKIIPRVAKPAVTDIQPPKPVLEKPARIEPRAAVPVQPAPAPAVEPMPTRAAEAPKRIVELAAAKPVIDLPSIEPEKRPSFFARLFGGGKGVAPEPVTEVLPPVEREPDPEPEEIVAAPVADVAETKPTLLARLSEIGGETADDEAEEADILAEDAPDSEPIEDADDASEEAGPLTLSLMDLKSKDPQKPSPIRSFPWLRGY